MIRIGILGKKKLTCGYGQPWLLGNQMRLYICLTYDLSKLMFCVACVWKIAASFLLKFVKTCALTVSNDDVMYGSGSVIRARGSLFWKSKFWQTENHLADYPPTYLTS
jgi:hypothetical protein